MKKSACKFITLFFTVILFLTGCSSGAGGDTATITISLNTDSVTDKAAINIEQLRHVLTLSGPTGKQTLTITGSGNAKATVIAGTWRIDVEAFLGSDLYATGSATADVKAGRNTNVTIYMNVVWTPPSGGGGGGGGGRTGGNPWTATATDWAALKTIVDDLNSTGGGNAVILITQHLTVDSTTGTISIANGTNITLMANSAVTMSRDVAFSAASPNQFFIVDPGTLILGYPGMAGNLTIMGDSGTTISELIKVDNGGTLEMNNGVTLTGNARMMSMQYGGAVNVSTGSTFNMKGGYISANIAEEGGGVYIDDSDFYMTGGIIENNEAFFLGGGVCVMDGNFTMTGGTIGKDSADPLTGGNDANRGGGVYVNNWTLGRSFDMSGDATIAFNKASIEGGGVFVTGGVFTMTDSAKVSSNGENDSGNGSPDDGGGVYITGGCDFTMQVNSEVSGNTSQNGGGVYVSGGTITLRGWASVTNNTIVKNSGSNIYGGGIFVVQGILNMRDNSSVSGNAINYTATGWGGGVFLYGDGAGTDAELRLSGGTIYGNEPANGLLRNTITAATSNGAALAMGSVNTDCIAEYGSFDSSDNWIYAGDLLTPNTDDYTDVTISM